MRNKIKQIMKKEEGFTLVELLAVIVILGIIVAIAIPAVGNIIDNSETEASKANATLIEDAARLYDIENDITSGEQESAGVTVSELIDKGFLELREYDEKDGKVYKIENTDNSGYTYRYSGRPE